MICRVLPFRLLLSGLLLAMPGCGDQSPGTTGVLSGPVYDAVTGFPLGGATVSVAGRSTRSTADGHYRLAGLPAGAVHVTVSLDGYQDYATDVMVTARSEVVLALPLLPVQVSGTPLRDMHASTRVSHVGPLLSRKRRVRSIWCRLRSIARLA